jgi:hypothetical protein
LRIFVDLSLLRTHQLAVATRQTSSSGRPKSPRIQVVLPEDLCQRLAALAEGESRTVSNMAKVLIQQGVERLEQRRATTQLAGPVPLPSPPRAGQRADLGSSANAEQFRERLELQERQRPSRLRGAPRRLRLQRPGPL